MKKKHHVIFLSVYTMVLKSVGNSGKCMKIGLFGEEKIDL